VSNLAQELAGSDAILAISVAGRRIPQSPSKVAIVSENDPTGTRSLYPAVVSVA
jgi:hypothetical protein